MGRRVAFLVAGAFLSACAPRLQPMGPATAEPRLTADAIVAADGYRLPLRRWVPVDGVPTRAIVLALHGFNDYSKSFDGPGGYFAGRGVAVYAYDQRGFGATRNPGVWAGGDTLAADARAALKLLADAHPGLPVFLMGESMGGAAAILALTGGAPLPVRGAVLSAPAVWGFESMGFWPRNALKLAYAAVPGMVATAPPELNIRPSDNIEMLKALAADPLVIKGARVDALYGLTEMMGAALTALPRLDLPTLALYGAHEQVLPPEPVAKAKAALAAKPQATVKVYAHGWHMLLRDLQAAQVWEDAAAWIDGRLQD